jgi:hypothetical protein
MARLACGPIRDQVAHTFDTNLASGKPGSDTCVHVGYHASRLSCRRSTIRQPHRAEERTNPSKALELETRIARLEITVRGVTAALEVLGKRTTAIQAQLDHLTARIGRL